MSELGQGMPAIKPNLGMAMADAAGVCLELQDHTRGVELQVIGHISKQYILDWPAITDQTRRTWMDLREAVEYEATAIAVLLYKNELGYSVVERSRQGTGIDYWMGQSDDVSFQRQARLEISGILNAGGDVARAIRARVNQKLRQTERASSSLPTYVIVVEFGSPIAEVQEG